MKQLVPYSTFRRSDGEITLEVREGRIDRDPLTLDLINRQERVVALHRVGYGDWDVARLAVRMHVPEVPDPSARGWSDVNAAVVISNRRSNSRYVAPLDREGSGVWTGDVRLDRDEHLGRLELSGVVVATVDGERGRLIGAPEGPWTVDLDARTPSREQSIRTVAADFTDPDHPHLHDFRQDEWTVDPLGDSPTLYINTAVEGVAQLLRASKKGMTPAEIVLQQAITAKIGTDMWITLFNTAAYAVTMEEGEAQWPGGWQDAVLKSMLPDVYPDRSPDDALTDVVTRRTEGDSADLHARVLHAAGRQAKTTRALGEALRTARKGGSK
ncbi:hypothetical protein AB0F96_15270 [Streptomyces sp. NPDC023998]|uniref:hypothetical protein n=1 Tax=Streptomyces sp. NPDC023998 TaxID=3154597 RepID=UPI0033F28C8D